MKRIIIAVTLLTLLVAWGAIGQAQIPVKPIIPIQVREQIPTLLLDFSQATFTQPVAGTSGTWFIPIKELQAILNAPPTQDTPIGVVIAGPNLAILDFKVVNGTSQFTITKLEISADHPIIALEPQFRGWDMMLSETPWCSAEGPWNTSAIAGVQSTHMSFSLVSPEDPLLYRGTIDVDFHVWRIHVHIHVEWD